MKISEILIKARELIATPEAWCKGFYGLDKDGKEQHWKKVHPKTSSQLDAIGACHAVVNTIPTNKRHQKTILMDGTNRAMSCGSVDGFVNSGGSCYYSFNDYNDAPDTTHQDILKFFNNQIDKQQAKEK